jgi:hypothetical protein
LKLDGGEALQRSAPQGGGSGGAGMREAIGVVVVLLPLAACIPAKIVEADGPRVTYSWSSADTSLDRVYSLAITYCDPWNAPPRLVADTVDGQQHSSTFECVPRPTLPFGQSPAGRLLNKI